MPPTTGATTCTGQGAGPAHGHCLWAVHQTQVGPAAHGHQVNGAGVGAIKAFRALIWLDKILCALSGAFGCCCVKAARATLLAPRSLPNQPDTYGWWHRSFPPLDKTVFAKTTAALGGRLRGILSGAAPLAPYIEDFLKATMGCPVIQVGAFGVCRGFDQVNGGLLGESAWWKFFLIKRL